MSRICGEKDVASWNCQISSIRCALAQGSIVATKKPECRRCVSIEKDGSGDLLGRPESRSLVCHAIIVCTAMTPVDCALLVDDPEDAYHGGTLSLSKHPGCSPGNYYKNCDPSIFCWIDSRASP